MLSIPVNHPDGVWRDWTPADEARQRRRVCSVSGCEGAPVRVLTLVQLLSSGVMGERRWVLCTAHAAEFEQVR